MNRLFQDRLPIDEFDKRRRAFDESTADKFDELIALVGLDPLADLRYGDFAGCCFDETDIRHFDLTGCDLRGVTFKGAFIQGAIFDAASVERAALMEATDFDAWFKSDLKRPAAVRRRVDTVSMRDFAVFREVPFAPEMVVLPAGSS